jgi:hypothetical protein
MARTTINRLSEVEATAVRVDPLAQRVGTRRTASRKPEQWVCKLCRVGGGFFGAVANVRR